MSCLVVVIIFGLIIYYLPIEFIVISGILIVIWACRDKKRRLLAKK